MCGAGALARVQLATYVANWLLNHVFIYACALARLHMARSDSMANRAACEFSRSGDQLAVCGAGGEVKIWDSGSGTLKQRFKPACGEITCLSWSRHTKVRVDVR